MPALQVRDFPEDLYEALRKCAADQDRSISQQTVHVLRRFLEAYRSGTAACDYDWAPQAPLSAHGAGTAEQQRVAKRRALLAQLESLPCYEGTPAMPDAATMVREMRAERDASLAATADEWEVDAR